MAFENYIEDKKAIIIGLDNVIYPEKDYLLQVYYLFSEFLAYIEQFDSAAVIQYMQAEFAEHGTYQLFEKTAAQFNIPLKYQENFEKLHQNARLPLKLLLYKQVLAFLQEVVIERKQLYLLVDGDPAEQINKIRQLEWHGLEQYLKVYFTVEFEPKPSTKSIEFILKEHNLNREEILMVGNDTPDELLAKQIGISYLSVSKLL